MAEHQIRFEDGAAYERMMGVWTRYVADIFLDWVAPPTGLRWIDVGCGNGAFTELLCSRCAPAEIQGIDPSGAQLAFARTRPGAHAARFHQGDAMALPFPDNSFDAAAMALVIFFVPDPAKGVAEMMRVVRPGGIVAVETREITVSRTFDSFDDLWETCFLAPALATILANLPTADIARLKARTRELLPPDNAGRVTCAGRANAIKGRVPKQEA